MARPGRDDAVVLVHGAPAGIEDNRREDVRYGIYLKEAPGSVVRSRSLPSSTIDWAASNGLTDIPIEERAPDEVTELARVRVAPPGVGARNPAFDVTPNRYVAAIITERGVARAPYSVSLPALVRGTEDWVLTARMAAMAAR